MSPFPVERDWTLSDLEVGDIMWATNRPRGYLWFIMYVDHKAMESIREVDEYNAHVQGWLNHLSNFNCTFENRKGSASINAYFFSHDFPLPATGADTTGPD